MAAPPVSLRLMAGTLRYRATFVATVFFGLTYLVLRCWAVWGRWLEFTFSVIFELPLIIWIILGGAEKWTVVEAQDVAKQPSLCELENFTVADFPEVIVYIPTYDEPASVLFPVITAALEIDYPVDKLKILVLDDGGRDFVQNYVLELSEANLGCSLDYIARIKPAKHWAKAGNINNAFIEQNMKGDFVLIIDADMVVSPNILQRMLPAFYDKAPASQSTESLAPTSTVTAPTVSTQWIANKVAWCQSPQTFSNIKWGDPCDLAQTMWYRVGIVGRDDFAAVPFCGTNAILRSSALSELGGLKYGALTEDLHSSMCLAARGWRGRYVAESLAVGLAPPNLHETFIQRIRWARGSWDMLTLDNVIFSKHLTVRQKASWLMLGYMPIVAACILITIIFRFICSDPSTMDVYSWAALTLHFALARFASLFSPGAGTVAPLYLMWRDSTAFFTYFSIHLFTLWTAVTCTTAKFVTTGKESDDPEAGRWHPLCWWNVLLGVGTGVSLVWLTDANICDSVTTFGAFAITLYIFISNWDVMSVILNPMTRWPLDPHANNTTIKVQPYVPREYGLASDSSAAVATAAAALCREKNLALDSKLEVSDVTVDIETGRAPFGMTGYSPRCKPKTLSAGAASFDWSEPSMTAAAASAEHTAAPTPAAGTAATSRAASCAASRTASVASSPTSAAAKSARASPSTRPSSYCATISDASSAASTPTSATVCAAFGSPSSTTSTTASNASIVVLPTTSAPVAAAPAAAPAAASAAATAAVADESAPAATVNTVAAVSVPSTAAPAPAKVFMKWFAGLRGMCILLIVLSHVVLGAFMSGQTDSEAWGRWVGMPDWIAAALWPTGAAFSSIIIALKILVLTTGFGLSLSCSRKDVNFWDRAAYFRFVKTRLHRLLLLCYINIAVYVLQDMVASKSFHFTSAEHWIDLAHTVTFTGQFTTKYFYPRSNGVLWYMNQLIINSIFSFPVLHMAMKKFGPLLPYLAATGLSATVRYFGVLYTPEAQLSPIHHPIAVSFAGYLGMFTAGMAIYHFMAAVNSKYQTLSERMQRSMWLVRWLLFTAGFAYVSYNVFHSDRMRYNNWYTYIDSSSWQKFSMAGSFLDIPLELAFIAVFMALGMQSHRRILPEVVFSAAPLALAGAMTFSIFLWHFRPCATLLYEDFKGLKCLSVLLFSLLPIALLSYRCIEKYDVVGFWRPFKL